MTHPMRQRFALRPDLNECVLEGRSMLAYSPTVPGMIWTQSGLIVLSNPPGFLSFIGPGSSGGSSGNSSGGNIPTSFNISGFGPTSITIGNSTGYPGLNPSGAASSSLIGGGGGGSGSDNSPTPNASKAAAFGGAFSSGYNTSLNSSNNYGMSSSPVGAIPVHTFANGEQVTPVNQDNSGTVAGVGQDGGVQGAPNTFGHGNGGQGPITNLWNNLLRKRTARTPP